MFAVCPKCTCALPPTEHATAQSCPACGLIFRKYLEAQHARPAAVQDDAQSEPEVQAAPLLERLLATPDETRGMRMAVGGVLWLVAACYAWQYSRMDIGPDGAAPAWLMHSAIIPFHEFGHILFSPFGEFMHVAGGSLAQFLMPLAFGVYFVFWRHDNLAGWLMLWWEGFQWVDLAPYCYDAQVPTMILLTGRTGDTGAHDYIDMLGDLGLLYHAQKIGWLMQKFGSLLFILALAWGVALLVRQWQAHNASL